MRAERGITLVEVLVTLVILAIGLLGLVGLQGRVQVLQIESYQRAQALILLNDMAGRVANNRNDAVSYVTASGTSLGADVSDCSTVGTLTSTPSLQLADQRRLSDWRDWCAALKGASETQSGSSVGAMVGGRGCVEDLGGGAYLVTVAWQGLVPIARPDALSNGVACGRNQYDGGTGSTCVGDLCRRFVTTVVQISSLT